MLNGLIFVLIRLLNCVIYYEKNKQLSWYDNSSYKWDKRIFSVSLCQTVENKTPELRKWQFPYLGITIQ